MSTVHRLGPVWGLDGADSDTPEVERIVRRRVVRPLSGPEPPVSSVGV